MQLSQASKVETENIQANGAIRLHKVESAKRKIQFIAFGIEFIVLFVFWVLVSGHYQLHYLLIGVAACVLTTCITKDLMYKPRDGEAIFSETVYTFSCIWRLVLYVPWLVWAIIKANIQVAIIILSPRMSIDPGFLRFNTHLKKKISMVTLANSITLTPGTITVDLTGHTYIIHAIVRGSASDLESGLMQNKAGAIFCDHPDPAPSCFWTHSCEELEK